MSHKQAKLKRRERREIQDRLAEQLRLLRKRCKDFDEGDWGEAVDIAARLRVIFNPGGKSSPSILKSLDAQKVPILSTWEPHEDSDNIIEIIGGPYTQRFRKDENGLHYELSPVFGNSHYKKEMPASLWWEQIVNIIATEAGKLVYRRKDVIRDIANKDGGAHVASQIPEAYDVLSKPGGIITITMGSEDNNSEVPIAGVHFAMVRQMAYEVLNSPALIHLSDSNSSWRISIHPG